VKKNIEDDLMREIRVALREAENKACESSDPVVRSWEVYEKDGQPQKVWHTTYKAIAKRQGSFHSYTTDTTFNWPSTL